MIDDIAVIGITVCSIVAFFTIFWEDIELPFMERKK